MDGLLLTNISNDIFDGEGNTSPDEKKCSKCKEIKPLGGFYTQPNCNSGYQSECKECNKKRKRKYRKENLQRVQEQDAKRNNKDRVKRLKQATNYYWNNRESLLPKKREYSKSEKCKSLRRLWGSKNKDKVSLRNKRYFSKIENRIRNATSSRIWKGIKTGTSRIESKLGYNIDELKNHLEEQFKDGMSWDNYGFYGWHIDHIMPVSSFKYSSVEDDGFKECWALSNLQPLWAEENMSKSNKIIGV